MNLKKLLAFAVLAGGLAASAFATVAASPFAGSWSGTFTNSAGGSGTAEVQISQNGVIGGTIVNQAGTTLILHGHVNNQGRFTVVALAPPDLIVPYDGVMELDGENVIGTFSIRTTDITGEFEFAPAAAPALSQSAAGFEPL